MLKTRDKNIFLTFLNTDNLSYITNFLVVKYHFIIVIKLIKMLFAIDLKQNLFNPMSAS